MGELEHFTLEWVVRDEKSGTKVWHLMEHQMAAYLKRRGFKAVKALPKPTAFDGEVKFLGHYRALCQWIPDWSPAANAGHVVARMDVLASADGR